MPRYMMLLRAADNPMLGDPPPALFEAIGKLGQQMTDAGTLLDTGGLAPQQASTRLRLSEGEVDTEGFPAGEQVIAYALLRATNQEQAIGHATSFLDLHRQYWPGWQGATEIRQVFGPNE